MKQFSFFKIKSSHRFNHGGVLRKARAGRGKRPLSSKEPLHLVFKARKERMKHSSLRSYKTFPLVIEIIRRYAKRFFIKIEELSVQNDHIHLIIRCSRRSLFHYFFRVVAGQIAQSFEKEGYLMSVTDTQNRRSKQAVTDTPKRSTVNSPSLWIYRPFSRVVRSYKAYQVVRAYVRLNEKEARNEVRYRKNRLRELSPDEWKILWS